MIVPAREYIIILMENAERPWFGNSKWSKVFRITILLTVLTYPFLYNYKFIFNIGDSMNPTLHDKELLVTQKYISNYIPVRYDIVIINMKTEKWSKRIIGLPGETVTIIDGVIYINDNPLLDDIYGDSIIGNMNDDGSVFNLQNDEPKIIPEGFVWVIGDNRDYSDYGIVSVSDIVGKVIW